jgi:hypothetical protein
MRKSFQAASRDSVLEFETSTGEVFHCRPRMAAGVILKFTDTIASEGDEVKLSEVIKGLKLFMRGALFAEDYMRFMAMLDDPDTGIELSELMEIAGWLASEHTGRPTGADSPSTSSTSPTGAGSTVSVSPVVSTSSGGSTPTVYSRPTVVDLPRAESSL